MLGDGGTLSERSLITRKRGRLDKTTHSDELDCGVGILTPDKQYVYERASLMLHIYPDCVMHKRSSVDHNA